MQSLHTWCRKSHHPPKRLSTYQGKLKLIYDVREQQLKVEALMKTTHDNNSFWRLALSATFPTDLLHGSVEILSIGVLHQITV